VAQAIGAVAVLVVVLLAVTVLPHLRTVVAGVVQVVALLAGKVHRVL
jgi:hypothetical protein